MLDNNDDIGIVGIHIDNLITYTEDRIMKRAWRFMLTERNGEQEYSYNYLVWAETEAQANDIAHDYANRWYGDDGHGEDHYDKDNDCFEFEGGALIATITGCVEADPAEFAMELAAQYTIGIPNTIIETIEQLKELASVDGGFDCFIVLNGGLRSSKHISYVDDEKLFYVWNYIDFSEQTLTEAEIKDSKLTNIGDAMAKGALIAD